MQKTNKHGEPLTLQELGNNELWQLEVGFIAGYTEDKTLMRSIGRYKEPQGWRVMATYSSGARQYKIPAEQRRVAERYFDVSIQ